MNRTELAKTQQRDRVLFNAAVLTRLDKLEAWVFTDLIDRLNRLEGKTPELPKWVLDEYVAHKGDAS